MKFILSISGASGVIYGVKLLQEMVRMNLEVHLIMSETAKQILKHEIKQDYKELYKLAYKTYENNALFSPPSSGSFEHDGMIVVPCSMKTLSAVANGYGDTLTTRAALCCLKENRKLILVPRETPLDLAGIKNTLLAKENGAVILPAMPAFYHKPEKIGDLVNFIVGKILDQLSIKHSLFKRWG